MEEKISRICGLLDEIKSELLCFEQETIEIISCDTDSIEEHTENRVKITEKMDVVFKEIDRICIDMDGGAEIRKIIRNVSMFTTVEPRFEPVFFKAQGIFSILNRIKDSDVQAIGRINIEREVLLKKIREMNNGQEAKASKFAAGTDLSFNSRYFGQSKKTV